MLTSLHYWKDIAVAPDVSNHSVYKATGWTNKATYEILMNY